METENDVEVITEVEVEVEETEAAVPEHNVMQTPAGSGAPESKWKEMQNIGWVFLHYDEKRRRNLY